MLPFQGVTPQSRHTGYKAAASAATRRESLQSRYVKVLEDWARDHDGDGLTDHEAARILCCPVSSMCSTRAGIRTKLRTHGEREGPYGEPNTIWILGARC